MARLAVLAASLGAAHASCQVRLVNEAAASVGPVTLKDASGSILVSNLAPASASSYVSFACDTPSFWASSATWAYNATSPGAVSRATVLVSSQSPAEPQAAAFVDASSALSDQLGPYIDGSQPSYMDQCTLRVLNAYGFADSVTVSWWTANCFDCAIPPGATVPFLGSSGDAYVQIYCGQDVQIRVAAPGLAQTLVTNMAEHGAFTVLVRNTPAESLTLLVDVPSDFPYTALIVGGVVMCALAVLNKIVRHFLVRSGLVRPEGSGGAQQTSNASALASPVSALMPIWHFLGYDTFAREQAAASTAAERGASAEIAGAEPLIPKDSFGGVNSDPEAPSASAAQPARRVVSKAEEALLTRLANRIRSIDAFRGACLCFMIFFNTGGGGYWFMDHSYWNGLTVADLVFPCFVFTQGVSMAISFDSLRRKKASRSELSVKVIIRAIKLYAIGCFINGGGNLSQWRFLGVLQYFAVGYLIVGLLETHLCPPPAASETGEAALDFAWGIGPTLRALLHDVGRYWRQWLVMAVFAAVYLLTEYLLPIEGCPTGYLGPGGLANNGAYLGKGCTGGAHRAVDVAIFGEAHMYHYLDGKGVARSHATCADPYKCDVYDPEGALGWISAAWQTWLGLQAGRVFVHHRKLVTGASTSAAKMRGHATLLVRWVVWGLLLGALGGGLCGFSQNDGLIPINKNMWSPTFVLCMSSVATLSIALFYVCVDMFPGRVWSGSPFVYPGMNSITIYTVSELLGDYFPFKATPHGQFANHSEAMASNLLGISCFVVIARWMYLHKIFINV